MPMRDRVSRAMEEDITVDDALREIRRYPDVVPEVTAISLMRQVDSWDEHRAILKALDVVRAEIAGA